MTTLAEQWKQESKAETVIEVLEARFGSLDPVRREKIMRMSTGELSQLSSRVGTALTLDEALAGNGNESH